MVSFDFLNPFVFNATEVQRDDLWLRLTGSTSDDSNPALGWAGVFCSWVFFGSFAVPMKWQSVIDAQVHPLIYQGYKTFWTVVTSHLVIFIPGVGWEFSWWGLASGFSWVPAGVAAVMAVQNVGIAMGQALWQVTGILMGFIWGLWILNTDSFQNLGFTILALFALTAGVVGMTLSFNLKRPEELDDVDMNDALEISTGGTPKLAGSANKRSGNQAPVAEPDAEPHTRSMEEPLHTRSVEGVPRTRSRVSTGPEQLAATFASFGSAGSALVARRRKSRKSLSEVKFGMDAVQGAEENEGGVSFPSGEAPRQASVALGIGAALFNGVWGSANLVPSFYAPYHGIHFQLSFAYGAGMANLTLFLFYYILCKTYWKCNFPAFHFRVMALPGFVSGSLWSAGNFCSLYVVTALGQGFGNSMIQSSVIVAGLWGILWYQEVTGRPILYWCLWCAVCVAGILGLASEKCHDKSLYTWSCVPIPNTTSPAPA